MTANPEQICREKRGQTTAVPLKLLSVLPEKTTSRREGNCPGTFLINTDLNGGTSLPLTAIKNLHWREKFKSPMTSCIWLHHINTINGDIPTCQNLAMINFRQPIVWGATKLAIASMKQHFSIYFFFSRATLWFFKNTDTKATCVCLKSLIVEIQIKAHTNQKYVSQRRRLISECILLSMKHFIL